MMTVRRIIISIGFLTLAHTAVGETVVASRMIRAQSVLMPSDVSVVDEMVPGALSTLAQAVGKESRVNLYQGRPIRAADLGPPAIVERNQLISLRYFYAGLAIVTEGRALGRGGAGESIRVMNLDSRATVTGEVLADGSVSVAPAVQ